MLSLPVAWVSACDGDVGIQSFCIEIGNSLPGGASGAFNKSKFGVEVYGVGVVIADVKPDIIYFFLAGMLHGAFGEGTSNAFTAVGGMHSDVGNEIDALLVVPKGDEAGVANDVSILFPDVACKWKGCCFNGTVGPLDEGVVFACAAHILHVAPAICIHGAGEAQFDEVCDSGKVPQNAEGAQVRMAFSARGYGDGGHMSIIVLLGVVGSD